MSSGMEDVTFGFAVEPAKACLGATPMEPNATAPLSRPHNFVLARESRTNSVGPERPPCIEKRILFMAMQTEGSRDLQRAASRMCKRIRGKRIVDLSGTLHGF